MPATCRRSEQPNRIVRCIPSTCPIEFHRRRIIYCRTYQAISTEVKRYARNRRARAPPAERHARQPFFRHFSFFTPLYFTMPPRGIPGHAAHLRWNREALAADAIQRLARWRRRRLRSTLSPVRSQRAQRDGRRPFADADANTDPVRAGSARERARACSSFRPTARQYARASVADLRTPETI